ncbi:MAG TPA: flagellar basal body P-ring protein FlgI [Candidatus Deferrimicrobium sp.]|nr:flagellar basal body P-ring protein FlgI [Candidatus Deferrimicrobium sp.]
MKKLTILSLLIILMGASLDAVDVRIKDIAAFEGVRDNQLIGYGVIVGLEGTGDTIQNKFTFQAMANLLDKMGLKLEPSAFQMRNTAAVAVTAMLPPFARVGSKIDVTVSSIGSAKSIQGGILLITPLKAADGEVYAVGQGPVSIGGFNATLGAGTAGTGIQKNHSNVGRIPNGALVEKEVNFNFTSQPYLTLVMYQSDFTTTTRVVNSINKSFGDVAAAVDPRTIRIMIPETYSRQKVLMASMLENLVVEPDSQAKVIINERTGTIVFGENVRISKVAVAHGNITIAVKTEYEVYQPSPLSRGETVVVPDRQTTVTEEPAHFTVVEQTPTISEVVKALNSLGASPRDIIAILQAIKSAGALQAELEMI